MLNAQNKMNNETVKQITTRECERSVRAARTGQRREVAWELNVAVLDVFVAQRERSPHGRGALGTPANGGSL